MKRMGSTRPRPFQFAMTLLAVLILGAGFQQMTAASAALESTQGEIVSLGSWPYTETVRQMAARDAYAQAPALPTTAVLSEGSMSMIRSLSRT